MQQQTISIQNNGCYCFTLETIDTVDIFTKPMYKQIVVHSLNHFINSSGLVVYGWCLMSNKLYLICQVQNNISFKDLIKNFAAFTSEKITESLKDENSNRNLWLLKHFEKPLSFFDDNMTQSCWGELTTLAQIDLKTPTNMAEQLEFIHGMPVKERVVQYSADYLYSSARDYENIPGLVKITKPTTVDRALYEIETRKNGFRRNYN